MKTKIKLIEKSTLLIFWMHKRYFLIEINFENQKINVFDAVLLGKNGVNVPEKLIEYEDTKIDYSDIPEITEKDIESGKIKWTVNAEIPLEKEITDRINKEGINLSEFAAKLIRNFYEG